MPGDHGPRPYPQHEAATAFLRVPAIDWTRVKVGEKTAFRTLKRRAAMRLHSAKLPTPVVAYMRNNFDEYDYMLMVLESHRIEPVFLASDSPEALEREGFPDHDHFRRYWRARHNGVYRPMDMVHVWELRPWDEETDFVDMGRLLLDRLYGEFYGCLKSRQFQS